MASFKLDPIFKGGISSGATRALVAFLEEKSGEFDRYVVPSIGNYTAAQVIAQSGFDTSLISCSDTNLYSAVLGYLFDPTKSIADLGFKVTAPVLDAILTTRPILDDDPEIVAATRILYAIKWSQLQGPTYYIQGVKLEVEVAAKAIMNAYSVTLKQLESLLTGLHFDLRAPYDHIADAIDDEKALIVFNTTHYGRVFPETAAFTWNRPAGLELKEDEIKEIEVEDANACLLVYGAESRAVDDLHSLGWEAMYAELNVKKMTRTYFMSNRDSEVGFANRRKLRQTPKNLPPIYDDHEITAETEIGFLRTDMDMGLYFYDLFVKDLGMVKAEFYYLFCIDGQVAGACGFDSQTYRTKRIPRIYQTFGLSMTSERYARLGRLLIAGLCSKTFVDQFAGEHVIKDTMLPPIEEIQTTCLTKYHEAKKNRGLMKLVSREKMPNGRFQLIYRTTIHPTTYKDVVEKWIKKHAGHARKAQGGTTQ